MAKTLKEARHELATERATELVSNWISEMAIKDNGKVFWCDTNEDDFAPVTYGDLRRLMRNDADIQERLIKEAADG